MSSAHDSTPLKTCARAGGNDVSLDDVFVPDERVLADRPHGVDPAMIGKAMLEMTCSGGSSTASFKGSPIERAYRDIRAAKFHPLSLEDTLLHAWRWACHVTRCDANTPGPTGSAIASDH